MAGLWSLRAIRNQIYAVFFTLLFILLYPPSIVAFIPVYLTRFLVYILKRLVRPDLDKMIVTRSSVLALDDPYKNPKWNICVWIVMEGNLNFAQFRSNFHEKFVRYKLPNGKFRDPEYQQYYYKWLGFLFWKWEEAFDIKFHMRYYYGNEGTFDASDCDGAKSTSETELKDIVKKLTWAPFQRKKSPWEFLFIPNYKTESDGTKVYPKSVLLFRVHHGFCDGLTIVKLLMEDANNVSVNINAQPNYAQRSAWTRFKGAVTFPFVAPYQLMKMVVHANDHNEWHRTSEQKLTRPFNSAFTQKIPLKLIKDIKNAYEVSFTAVVMSAIAGGIQNVMIMREAIVPKNINAAIPVPMPNHPHKLRNHFIFSFLKLPVGIKDPERRLRKMEQNIRELKQSYVPLLNFSMIPIVGGLYQWMMKPFCENPYSTALISNFPGPNRYGDFIAGGGAHWITDMNFSAGFGAGKVGLGFCMMSYGDSIRIISEVDSSILPDDASVHQLNNEILNELQKLSCMTIG